MIQEQTLADKIIEQVLHLGTCKFDELVLAFPELTCREVFSEIHRLRQAGQLVLTLDDSLTCIVRLPGAQRRPA